MKTNLGETAEKLLRALEGKGPIPLTAFALNAETFSATELGLAVGWLAGGDHIRVERRNGSLWVVPASSGERRDSASIRALVHEIPRVLLDQGAMTLASLGRQIPGATSNLVALAIGWLASQGVVTLGSRPEGLEVSLRPGSLSHAIL